MINSIRAQLPRLVPAFQNIYQLPKRMLREIWFLGYICVLEKKTLKKSLFEIILNRLVIDAGKHSTISK